MERDCNWVYLSVCLSVCTKSSIFAKYIGHRGLSVCYLAKSPIFAKCIGHRGLYVCFFDVFWFKDHSSTDFWLIAKHSLNEPPVLTYEVTFLRHETSNKSFFKSSWSNSQVQGGGQGHINIVTILYVIVVIQLNL